MLPYGQTKRGSHKHHPHNECSICSENVILKNTARKEAEKEIQDQLNSNLFDLFGCDEFCSYCNGPWIECDSNPECDCEICIPKHENQGNGWKIV